MQALAAWHDATLGPVQETPDQIARLETRVAAGDDARNRARDDRPVELEARRIRRSGVHAAAQVRVRGQVQRLQQHVLGAALGLGTGLDAEAAFVDPANRPAAQHDASVHAAL
jgi:hypothetical protein